MKQKIANYTVVIEKQRRTGTNTVCYTAYVPVLGIATEADSVEEAEKAVQELIQFHLESLAQEQEVIPTETESSFITKIKAFIPKDAIAYS